MESTQGKLQDELINNKTNGMLSLMNSVDAGDGRLILYDERIEAT
jgi:hypothetical protein